MSLATGPWERTRGWLAFFIAMPSAEKLKVAVSMRLAMVGDLSSFSHTKSEIAETEFGSDNLFEPTHNFEPFV